MSPGRRSGYSPNSEIEVVSKWPNSRSIPWPEGEDPGGVDLWEVVGITDAGRLVFVVGRMGDDGLFRLISSRSLMDPEGSDRERVREYRRILRTRDAEETQE